MTTYTTQDENELCRAIYETGTKKYWELVDTLADLLHVTPDHTSYCGGRPIEESLCSFIAYARRVYEERKSIFKRRGLDIMPVDGCTTGQYRKTCLFIKNIEDDSLDLVHIDWQFLTNHPNRCWNLPYPPTLTTNAENAMKALTKTLHDLSFIIKFIALFRDTEPEIKQAEDEERKSRIIKYSAQLELLKRL